AQPSRSARLRCSGCARLRDLPRARRARPRPLLHRGIPAAPGPARTAGHGSVIGRISGLLLEKNPPQVLVDVRGVAYEVDVPMSTFYNLPQTGAEVTLYTHLVVREDAHLLFGFGTEAERSAFRQLLRISGIGARTALA